MSDDQILPVLPPDVTPSWLARNRKLAILLGVALILLGIAAVTYFLPGRQRTQSSNTNATVTLNVPIVTNEAPPNAFTRPTFQRSIIANVSTSPPPAYQPPTTEQLKQAIGQLNSATNTSP